MKIQVRLQTQGSEREEKRGLWPCERAERWRRTKKVKREREVIKESRVRDRKKM